MTDLGVHRTGRPEAGAPEGGDVPFALSEPDRIPVERYFDRTFAELEHRRPWTRAWQMACRLEKLAAPGDYVDDAVGAP